MDDGVFRKQVNASGFHFQLRVEHEVEATRETHKWRVSAREHRWINKHSGAEGFIDLILEKIAPPFFALYMVIECKRVGGGSWVFLTPHNRNQLKTAAHVLMTRQQHDKPVSFWWETNDFNPESPVSSFCTVPGQSDRNAPMLERVAGDLLDSLESLAEELSNRPQVSEAWPGSVAQYFPVIVTNTELIVCEFEPSEVDLSEGILKGKGGKFQSVPYIRFQKSFTCRYATAKVPMSLEEANKENQRTILVVQGPHLSDFLKRWDMS